MPVDFRSTQPIPFADPAAGIERRRIDTGPPRNRHTASKRALLAATQEVGGKW